MKTYKKFPKLIDKTLHNSKTVGRTNKYEGTTILFYFKN